MQLGYAAIVAVEKGPEILRQVILVELGQRADDAEVQRDIAAQRLRRIGHVDIAGCMSAWEKAVGEDLGEEDFHPLRASVGISIPAAQAARP